jgi:flagellar protein FlaG
MAIDIKSIAAQPIEGRRPAAASVSGERSVAAGNALPPGGEVPPPAAAPAPDLSRAIAVLNRFLADSQRSFRFQVDDASGRTIVRIVNPETGEVVRQIPSEDVLAAARALRDAGNLLDLRA